MTYHNDGSGEWVREEEENERGFDGVFAVIVGLAIFVLILLMVEYGEWTLWSALKN